MSHNRTTVPITLCCLLVVGAAACSSGATASSPNTPSGLPGSFSVAMVEPDTLIPGKSTDAEFEFAALFTPLVGLGADGTLQYLQARSMTPSAGDKTWTVKLRPGWTFQNGEPVTAQSYVDAWNYNAYGPNGNATSGELSNIVGYTALNPANGKPVTKTMSGLSAPNPTTIVIHLVEADSQLPYEMTANQWGFYPLPKAFYANQSGYNVKPIGDGPYEMDGTWHHNQYIKMQAYPAYAGPDKPKIKYLTFKLYTSADSAYTDVLAGNTDVAFVPGDKLGQFRAQFGARAVQQAVPSIEYLGFSLFDSRWRNEKLREAISMAINREAINKALFGGQYGIADSFLPPSTPGLDPHSCHYCTFDPAKAKQLLAEAGGFHGSMTLYYLGGNGQDQEMLAIANSIRQTLGINVIPQPSISATQYETNMTDKKDTQGPLDSGWGANYPSPQDMIVPLFTKAGAATGAQLSTNYTSPAVEKLIAEANAAPNTTSAIQLYHQAEAQVEADFPAIPLFFNSSWMVYSTNVHNVRIDRLGNIEYANVS